jgi:hypothetical protein
MMIRTLEEDTYGFWAEFGHRPGGARGEDAGATWFRSGVPFVNYNGVVGVGCHIDTMLARVRAWSLPARWIVSSASAGGVEAVLAERGLQVVDEAPGMVARIEDLPRAALDELTVEPVTGQKQWHEWESVFRDAFGFSEEVAAHVRVAHSWPCLHEEGRQYLLMRFNGVAVATGLLHWSRGVAGVYAIGVRRDFRRRGFGAFTTLLTVREGARRGATVAVLQATKEGFPVYARLGFQTVCTFRSWQIA